MFFVKLEIRTRALSQLAWRERSINLPPSQHRDLSRIFFSIQKCNCGIRPIQSKMRSTVWTVYWRERSRLVVGQRIRDNPMASTEIWHRWLVLQPWFYRVWARGITTCYPYPVGGGQKGLNHKRGQCSFQIYIIAQDESFKFKRTVSRDFLLLVFFMNQFPPSPRISH